MFHHPHLSSRIGLLLAVLAALAVTAAAGPKDLFDEIHARIEAAEKTRKTISARFVETTTSSLLTRPVVARGTLFGEKPAPGVLIGGGPTRMLIKYLAPEPKTVLFNTDHLVVIRPGQPTERIDIAEIMKNVNKYFTTASPDQLRRAFTIRAFLDPDVPACYQIDLLPRRKQIKQGLERLQLWVDKNTFMLSQMKMTFPGGDNDVFRLEDVKLNAPVPPGTFDVDVAAPAKTRKK